MKIFVVGSAGFIGSYLCDLLEAQGAAVWGLDKRHENGSAKRIRADATDEQVVRQVLLKIRPDAIVHLAARTDTFSNNVKDYADNWVTTEVLARCAIEADVSRFVFTSTQYVHEVTSEPSSDSDYSPFTAYGESKVIAEQSLRQLLDGSACRYVIARPTNVWGPRHPRYAEEVWRVMRRGWYLHPKVKTPVYRAYGYVGNVCWQLAQMADLDPTAFPSAKVLYVGDRLLLLDEWVDAFSQGLTGKSARRVPAGLMRAFARGGDGLKRLNITFPLTTSRFNNMIESSAAPMSPIYDLLGDPPYSLQRGVDETLSWLRVR